MRTWLLMNINFKQPSIEFLVILIAVPIALATDNWRAYAVDKAFNGVFAVFTLDRSRWIQIAPSKSKVITGWWGCNAEFYAECRASICRYFIVCLSLLDHEESMKNLPFVVLLLVLLTACATDDGSRLNPNMMSDEEIVAYNAVQLRVWTEILCIREVSIRSRIRKRHCSTVSEWNERGVSAGEQLNIISFGTPQIFH